MKLQNSIGLLLALFVVTGCGDKSDDDAAFSAPTGVTAQVVSANGEDTIEVSWTSVTDAVKYNIYMASQAGVTKLNYTTLPGQMFHPDNVASFPHPDPAANLDPNTIYYFIVTAVNAAGDETAESCEAAAKIAGSVDGSCGQ